MNSSNPVFQTNWIHFSMSKPINRRLRLAMPPSNGPTGIRASGEPSGSGEPTTQSAPPPKVKPQNTPTIPPDTFILPNADSLLSLGGRSAPGQGAKIARTVQEPSSSHIHLASPQPINTQGFSKIPCLRAGMVNWSAPATRRTSPSTAGSLIPRPVALRTPAQYRSAPIIEQWQEQTLASSPLNTDFLPQSAKPILPPRPQPSGRNPGSPLYPSTPETNPSDQRQQPGGLGVIVYGRQSAPPSQVDAPVGFPDHTDINHFNARHQESGTGVSRGVATTSERASGDAEPSIKSRKASEVKEESSRKYLFPVATASCFTNQAGSEEALSGSGSSLANTPAIDEVEGDGLDKEGRFDQNDDAGRCGDHKVLSQDTTPKDSPDPSGSLPQIHFDVGFLWEGDNLNDKAVPNSTSKIPRLRHRVQEQEPDLPPPVIVVVDEHGSNVLDPVDQISNASEASESSGSSPKSGVKLSMPNATLKPPSLHNIESEDFDSAEDDDFSDLLQRLMELHKPRNLSGEVSIPHYQKAIHGGHAVVYTGIWRGTRVGVKFLKQKKPKLKHGAHKLMRKKQHESTERRVNREMGVWAALKHPNICEFLGYVTDIDTDAYPAMISSWCDNGTALDYTENNDLSRGERFRLTMDMSEGLKYLHQLEIAHGDLKPGNIFIDHNGVAKLCDFGLVRLIDWRGVKGMTTTSPYTGTALYRAPELAVSDNNPHPVATLEGDMYSVGSIMLEFIEQVPPFQRFHPSHKDIRSAIMDNLPPALRKESNDTLEHMTEPFWDLLEACWGDAASRPTVTKIVEALIVFARELSISTY